MAKRERTVVEQHKEDLSVYQTHLLKLEKEYVAKIHEFKELVNGQSISVEEQRRWTQELTNMRQDLNHHEQTTKALEEEFKRLQDKTVNENREILRDVEREQARLEREQLKERLHEQLHRTKSTDIDDDR